MSYISRSLIGDAAAFTPNSSSMYLGEYQTTSTTNSVAISAGTSVVVQSVNVTTTAATDILLIRHAGCITTATTSSNFLSILRLGVYDGSTTNILESLIVKQQVTDSTKFFNASMFGHATGQTVGELEIRVIYYCDPNSGGTGYPRRLDVLRIGVES